MNDDEEQIGKLHAVYVQRTDDGDARGKSELFAEDARYYPSSGEVIGRKAIYATVASSVASRPADLQSKHMCGNAVITVSGDTAEAQTDYVVYRRQGREPWEILQIGGTTTNSYGATGPGCSARTVRSGSAHE